MANGTDHLLVSELMGRMQQREAVRIPMAPSHDQPARPRRMLDVVLWSGLTNLTLLACFIAGWNFDQIKGYLPIEQVAAAVEPEADDSLTVSRRQLQDNELLTQGPQRQLKGPLQFTLVPSTPADVPPQTGGEASAQSDPNAVASSDAPAEQEQGDGTGEITVGPEDPAAQLAKSPVLRKGPKSGDVEIGSFATVSMAGSASECLDTAYNLLEDAGAARDKLKVLAETRLITVARICASNGSLVVTCRSDQITISPRRLKPNETCTG